MTVKVDGEFPSNVSQEIARKNFCYRAELTMLRKTASIIHATVMFDTVRTVTRNRESSWSLSTREGKWMIDIFTSADDAVLVKSSSELDISTVQRFEAAVVAACARGCRSLRIDLTDCRLIDSSAISMFIRLSKSGLGNYEVAVLAGGPVHRILELEGALEHETFFHVVSEDSRERYVTTLHEWLHHERL